MATVSTNLITHVVFDVDGVFTTGQFLYTAAGKFAKIFGPHDADGIKLIRDQFVLAALSADHRGWDISYRRIAEDMKIPLTLVSEEDRLSYLQQNFPLATTAFMADGYYDSLIFPQVAYSLAPANAHPAALAAASYVTAARSGEGAVAEACFHLRDKFLISSAVTSSHQYAKPN